MKSPSAHPANRTAAPQVFKLHVAEQGAGLPALLFVHYWGGSSRTWAPVMSLLSGRYRCVAPDLRGWGRSTHQATDFSLQTQADDLEALVVDSGLTDYVLVGHSMGGKIAQILAGRRPSGLRALLLLAPAPPGGVSIPEEQSGTMLESYLSEDGITRALGVLTERLLPEALRLQVVEDTLGGQFEAKQAWVNGNMAADVSDSALSVNVPIHVIVGACDKVESERFLREEMPRFYPNADFTVLPGVGHLAPLEAPVDLARTIAALIPPT